MDHTDGFHIDGNSFDPLERDADDMDKGGHAQTSMKSIMNFRDHKGRTALHVAAIWGNKAACEALLYLKANPLIEDGGGYRAIDYVDPSSAIADLFKSWMVRAETPQLFEFGITDGVDPAGGFALKAKMMNAVEAKKGGLQGLLVTDLKQMSVESLRSLKYGQTGDNYL